MDLQGKNTVVTGAGRGIGAALAGTFHARGANVVLADLAGADEAAAAIGGDRVVGITADVSTEEGNRRLVESAREAFGPIDLFCSNAGIGIGKGLDEPVEVWQKIWEVNTLSHVFAAKHLIPRMKQRGGGYLLNTSSAAGLLSQIGSVTYAVTKHAAVALAEWIAITHGRDGIRVSVLCPQAVRTAMTAGGPGVAGVDGMLEPEVVAQCVVDTLAEENFLVLPHPEVGEYIKRKTNDYDRWLRGMMRLQDAYLESGEDLVPGD